MIGKLGLRLPSRSCQRLVLITVPIVILIIASLQLAGSSAYRIALRLHQAEQHVSAPHIGRCSHGERAAWAGEWNMTEKNHRDLLDDRFTYVMPLGYSFAPLRLACFCVTLLTLYRIALSTFHRPKELQRTLNILLSEKISSLLEIVIIWNNFDEDLPAPYVSPYGVDVRYRKPPRDSPNEKLWNDPSYRTRAILVSDDDVFYRPADLDFVFQIWRRFGRDRVTGALARCARADPAGRWEYSLCGTGDKYSLVLTNLAFVDISVLDAYNSDFAPVREMREYVDEASNCEDIALNFVAAVRVSQPDSRAASVGGPLLVRGSERYVNLDPLAGLSRRRGHLEARSECLNRFAKAFGCMPLVDEAARIDHGVEQTVWYKRLADLLRH